MKTRISLLAATVFALCTSAVYAKEYSFKLENNTDTRIVKIEASEDGKHCGEFDIGKGLPAHGKMELVWDDSTNSSGCEWKVRATYDDGSKAPPAEFDFCEDDIVLEFSE
jgi:hypothetical protein